MTEDTNKDELIEQYLLNQLEGDMLDEFRKRLASDGRFRREVALQRAILRNIKAVGREEWKHKLKGFHNELLSEEEEVEPAGGKVVPLKSARNKRFLLAAAAIIFLAVSSVLIFIVTNSRPDAEGIYLAYYKPYADLEQDTRGLPSGEATASEKKQAFKAYNEGNYEESIRLFKNILEKAEDEVVLFYLGNAYLSANKAPEAESAFKTYLDKYKEFATESRWYLSLATLRQGKTEEAKELLEELARENKDYSSEAREILNKL